MHFAIFENFFTYKTRHGKTIPQPASNLFKVLSEQMSIFLILSEDMKFTLTKTLKTDHRTTGNKIFIKHPNICNASEFTKRMN